METLIQAVWAIAPSIVVGIFMAFWNNRQKKRDEQERRQKQEIIESDMIRIDLEVASAQLSYAVAMAYKRGTTNGELEPAIEQYEKAMSGFRKFERKQIARKTLED